jgi:multidrug efflux pump subunit AcrB
MISAVFVDRPRLAIVIAFVITIAGALALLTIPVAQFPDIVPPQVTVSGVFPGASAEVVEASVAQPLEAQVVGVDRALYMKSTSGNDGSYTLTVSFALAPMASRTRCSSPTTPSSTCSMRFREPRASVRPACSRN